MPLKAEVENLDEVPEALRGEYEEKKDGGGFRLRIEGVEFPDQVAGLKSAFEKEKEERRRAKKELDALREKFGDIDLDKAREALEYRAQLEQQEAEKKGEWEKLREKMAQTHRTELEKIGGEVKKRDGFIERLLVDNGLTEAITKVGVRDEYRAAVKALLLTRKPKVVQDGEDYRAFFSTDMGEVPLTDYVLEWAKQAEAEPFIVASGASGGGASPNRPAAGGGNGKSAIRTKADVRAHGLTPAAYIRQLYDAGDKSPDETYAALPDK